MSKQKNALGLIAIAVSASLALAISEFRLQPDEQVLNILVNTQVELDEFVNDDAADAADASQQALFELARQQQKEQLDDAAISTYQQLLANNSHHFSANINLALLLQSQDRCADVVPLLDQPYLRISSSRGGKLLAILGACQIELGLYADAQTALAKSIEYRPDHKMTWRALAQAQAGAQFDYQTTLATYERAVSMDPYNQSLIIEHLDFMLQRLDFWSVVRSAKKQPDIHSQPEYLKRLIWAYIELERDTSAKKYLDILLNQHGDNLADELLWQGLYNLMAGRADKAQRLLQKLDASDDATMATLWFNYLEGNELIGRIETILTNSPSPALLTRITRLHAMQLNKVANWTGALTQYQSLIQPWLYLEDTGYSGSEVALNLNDSATAIRMADVAQQANPSRKNRLQAIRVSMEQNPSLAVEQLQELLQAYPDSRSVQRELARALYSNQQLTDAAAMYQQLVDDESYSPDQVQLAQIHQDLGQFDDAYRVLDELLQSQPKHQVGRWSLVQMLCDHQLADCQEQAQLLLNLYPDFEPQQTLLDYLATAPETEPEPTDGAISENADANIAPSSDVDSAIQASETPNALVPNNTLAADLISALLPDATTVEPTASASIDAATLDSNMSDITDSTKDPVALTDTVTVPEMDISPTLRPSDLKTLE